MMEEQTPLTKRINELARKAKTATATAAESAATGSGSEPGSEPEQ